MLYEKQLKVSNRWGKETMNRLASMIAAILTVTVIGSSGAAFAFSLHWGQSKSIDEYGTAQTTNGADIPTPQFFIVSIGQKPAPSTLSFAPPDDETAQPNIRMQPPSMPRQTAASPTLSQQAATTAHHLNGTELFLLREVQTTAARQ
jgi:hypothetical protein